MEEKRFDIFLKGTDQQDLVNDWKVQKIREKEESRIT